MSRHPLHAVLRLFRATLATGLVGLAALVAAIALASSRYRQCGPSSLDATQAACRLGAQVLMGAYMLLSAALVLGAICLTLLWRARHRQRQR